MSDVKNTRQILENPVELHSWLSERIDSIIQRNKHDFVYTKDGVFFDILRELSCFLVLTFEMIPPIFWKEDYGNNDEEWVGLRSKVEEITDQLEQKAIERFAKKEDE